MRLSFPCLLCLLLLVSCLGERQTSPDAGAGRLPPEALAPPDTGAGSPPPEATAPPPAAEPLARGPGWRVAYDFDGDGQKDRVVSSFSGGAHCCYRVGVALSSTGETVRLPFQMDGGYVGGLNLTQPHRFSIRTPEGALPELVMQIETYNGRPQPLNPAWVRRYGIRTHRVAVCFPAGKIHVRDFVPDLPPCLNDTHENAP